MNSVTKFASDFTQNFNKNLQIEIKNNKELSKSLDKINLTINFFNRHILNFKPIKLTTNVLIKPLKMTDYAIKKATNKLIIDKIEPKFNNFCKLLPIPFKQIDNFIPHFYGGNKFLKIDETKNEFFNKNRDESSIDFLENKLIPNIFLNSDFKFEDEKSKAILNNFYDYIRNKYKLKKHNFYNIECIDYRNVETDGYDLNEEITLSFTLKIKLEYFKNEFKQKVDSFRCFIRFDGDDRIKNFEFYEL
ncbi:hypothetical protein GVAV_000301 [Gurleya vavrai]